VEVPASEIDPVCGMTVEVATARHRAVPLNREEGRPSVRREGRGESATVRAASDSRMPLSMRSRTLASDTSIITRETVWRLLNKKASPNSTQTV